MDGSNEKVDAKKARVRSQKILPSDRLAFGRHSDAFRASVNVYEVNQRPFRIEEVADMVKISPHTLNSMKAFSSYANLWRRAAGGFVPGDELISFARAYASDPEGAPQKLAGPISKVWFAEALLSRLQVRPMKEGVAVDLIRELASAGPKHKRKIETALDYLEWTGLIRRENKVIRLGGIQNEVVAESQPKDTSGDAGAMVASIGTGNFSGLRFSINIEFSSIELSKWPTERIAALFGGLSQLLSRSKEVQR